MQQSRYPTPAQFWIMAFTYGSLLALAFQKLILPLLPEMHAAHGLLNNDAIYFHDLAAQMAERIRTQGWSEWRLFPGAAGNVGVLSAIYAVLGPDPAWFIPLNAAAHATGALLIYLMGPMLWPGRTGLLGGLIAGTLFVVFPSALQWYGQNHKDAFAIAGLLMTLYAWMKVQSAAIDKKTAAQMMLILVAGLFLMMLVRPYFTVVLAVALAVSWGVLLGASLVNGNLKLDRSSLQYALGFIAVASLIALYSTIHVESAKQVYGADVPYVADLGANWRWKHSENLPSSIDHVLERASELRAHFVIFNRSVGAGSAIDNDRVPDTAISALGYMPRALFVGLFAPFPSTWTERVSMPRLIGAMETFVWYVVVSGVIFLVLRQRSRALLAGIVFVSAILTLLSYIHPNVGTLYRQRYGLWMFVLLCGAVGWSGLLLPFLAKASGRRFIGQPDVTPSEVNEADRSVATRNIEAMSAAGVVVLMVTMLCYLGFMARDLLLLKEFGLSARLDALFSAMMIPMFLVGAFAMPAADALMRPLIGTARNEGMPIAARLVRGLQWQLCIILGALSLILMVFADPIASLVLQKGEATQIGQATIILRSFAPIIFISAWTVIGNAILNALHRSSAAAIAQLSVPICAIGFILASPSRWGVYPAVAGMMIGTVINALILAASVGKHGITLMPAANTSSEPLGAVMSAYRRLVYAALIVGLAVPMNYMFAGLAGEGAISSWAFSSKIVLMFNGLASVGTSAVLLPYLARLANFGGSNEIRSDVYFILQCASWIGGGLALSIWLFSEPVVAVLFAHHSMSEDQLAGIAGILKLGALQLPMTVILAVITKMVVVSGTSSKAVISAILGFAINVLINYALVPKFGVLGIANGSLIACGASTAYLMVSAREECGFGYKEIVTIVLGWIVWAGACAAVSSTNAAAIVCSFIGLLGLGWMQWRIWSEHHPEPIHS